MIVSRLFFNESCVSCEIVYCLSCEIDEFCVSCEIDVSCVSCAIVSCLSCAIVSCASEIEFCVFCAIVSCVFCGIGLLFFEYSTFWPCIFECNLVFFLSYDSGFLSMAYFDRVSLNVIFC